MKNSLAWDANLNSLEHSSRTPDSCVVMLWSYCTTVEDGRLLISLAAQMKNEISSSCPSHQRRLRRRRVISCSDWQRTVCYASHQPVGAACASLVERIRGS